MDERHSPIQYPSNIEYDSLQFAIPTHKGHSHSISFGRPEPVMWGDKLSEMSDDELKESVRYLINENYRLKEHVDGEKAEELQSLKRENQRLKDRNQSLRQSLGDSKWYGYLAMGAGGLALALQVANWIGMIL